MRVRRAQSGRSIGAEGATADLGTPGRHGCVATRYRCASRGVWNRCIEAGFVAGSALAD